MKQARLGIFFFLLVCFAKGQQCDTIHFINNDIIPAKIIEINQTSVKYYRCDNIAGPLYVLDKIEVNTINYSNGRVDSFNLLRNQSINNYNAECDSIFLTNGVKFIGSLRSMKGSLITFKYCEPNIFQTITVRLDECARKTHDKFQLLVKNEKVARELDRDIQRIEERREARINEVRYFHIGIIPYQLLSRSSGIYIRYDLKNIGIEYRPTYTYATNVFVKGMFPDYEDNFCYQGINNSLAVYFSLKPKTKIGVMLSYKYWWYYNQSITREYVSRGSTWGNTETESAYMKGIGFGVEMMHDISAYKNLDLTFFYNASLTYFNAYSTIYSYSSYGYYSPPLYGSLPQNVASTQIQPTITCGLKIGYRKPIRPKR